MRFKVQHNCIYSKISMAVLYKISSLKTVIDNYRVQLVITFKYLKNIIALIGKLSWKVKCRQQSDWNY